VLTNLVSYHIRDAMAMLSVVDGSVYTAFRRFAVAIQAVIDEQPPKAVRESPSHPATEPDWAVEVYPRITSRERWLRQALRIVEASLGRPASPAEVEGMTRCLSGQNAIAVTTGRKSENAIDPAVKIIIVTDHFRRRSEQIWRLSRSTT
jgi:hypothetical protein